MNRKSDSNPKQKPKFSEHLYFDSQQPYLCSCMSALQSQTVIILRLSKRERERQERDRKEREKQIRDKLERERQERDGQEKERHKKERHWSERGKKKRNKKET